jgi:hypothetical protein
MIKIPIENYNYVGWYMLNEEGNQYVLTVPDDKIRLLALSAQ